MFEGENRLRGRKIDHFTQFDDFMDVEWSGIFPIADQYTQTIFPSIRLSRVHFIYA